MASFRYRYAVAREIPDPWPSLRISGRSRNNASVSTARFQQVRARVPGAHLAAALRQQSGHEHDQLERDVKDDTTGQHGAFPPDGDL